MSSIATTPSAPEATATSTVYMGFVKITDERGSANDWQSLGTVTVKVGRSDLAKQETLRRAALEDPNAKLFKVAVVPAKSWQPEEFVLEVVAPRFVAKASA